MSDACAILYQRKGEFEKSIELFVDVLTTLSIENVISALCYDANIRDFNDPNNKNKDLKKFDEFMTMIIDICDQCGTKLLKEAEAEKLWLFSVRKIYEIKKTVCES